VSPLATSTPRPLPLANPNLFRNPNMVFESTYLCMATNKSLFPMAPGWSIPRLTEMELLIDSSTSLIMANVLNVLIIRSCYNGTLYAHTYHYKVYSAA